MKQGYTKEEALKIVKKWGAHLNKLSHEFKKDKEIVIAAIKKDGRAIQFADDSFKSDREIVMLAIENDGRALEHVSDDLKKDREIVLKALRDYSVLSYADESLRNDKQIVLKAVRKAGGALKYASDRLKNDRDVVLRAVQNDGRALEHASDKLKEDKEIVKAAIRENNSVFYEQISDETKKRLKEPCELEKKINNFGYQIKRDESYEVEKFSTIEIINKNGDVLKTSWNKKSLYLGAGKCKNREEAEMLVKNGKALKIDIKELYKQFYDLSEEQYIEKTEGCSFNTFVTLNKFLESKNFVEKIDLNKELEQELNKKGEILDTSNLKIDFIFLRKITLVEISGKYIAEFITLDFDDFEFREYYIFSKKPSLEDLKEVYEVLLLKDEFWSKYLYDDENWLEYSDNLIECVRRKRGKDWRI